MKCLFRKLLVFVVALWATGVGGTSQTIFVNGQRFSVNGSSLLTATIVSAADYTWSGTVGGSAKSSQAGFIAPVAWADGAGNLKYERIIQVSSPQTVCLYSERVLGDTGSISETVATFASTNTTSGVNFTAVSTTLTYADAVKGWQKVCIPILSIPTGFGIVGVQFGGSNPYHTYSYIWLQGTGHVASAKYLTSAGSGVESTAITTGSGTSGSPWQSPNYAAHQMTCGVLYVRSATGNYQDNTTGSDNSGGFFFNNNCTPSNPFVVVSDPDNVSPPVFDNGTVNVTDHSQSVTVSKNSGIICSNSCSGVWNVGLNITNGNWSNQTTSAGPYADIVLWKMDIGNYFITGSNAGAVRHESTDRLIVQDCKLHNVYSRETVQSNPFDAQPFGLKEGSITFSSRGYSLVQNEMYVVEYGLLSKDPPTTGRSADVEANYFHEILSNGVYYQNAGAGGDPLFYTTVRYNAQDESASPESPPAGFASSDMFEASGQSSYIDVYNNTGISTRTFFNSTATSFIRYWNNISQDAVTYQINIGTNASFLSSLYWGDYNRYVRGTLNWSVSPTSQSFSTLAGWQGASTNSNLVSSPDVNSATTSSTPGYTNQSGKDLRWTNALGQFGRSLGVGDALVGPQN